jgi:HD-like signal output (HDOD) protein
LGTLTGRVVRCSNSYCGVAEAVTVVRDTVEAVGECARLFGRWDLESALLKIIRCQADSSVAESTVHTCFRERVRPA